MLQLELLFEYLVVILIELFTALPGEKSFP